MKKLRAPLDLEMPGRQISKASLHFSFGKGNQP